MKIIFNENTEIVKKIRAGIAKKQGHCPCRLQQTEDILVDFWAVWCGPCQMQMPILEQLAEEKGLSAKVGKVNVDEQQELALRYGVELIPTLLVFKNGEVSTKFVGLTPLEKLKEAL